MQAQNSGIVAGDSSPDRVAPAELGWPFNALSPWTPRPSTPIKERLLIAALIGWWMHAFLFNIQNTEFVNGIGLMVSGYGGIILVIAKMGSYGGNHASPLNLAGRFWLLKWIIPGYDRVVVPLLVLIIVVPTVGLTGHFWLQVPGHTLIPLVTVAALWCFILTGPDPVNWKLTCPARITHGKLVAANYQQLT